MQSGYISYRSHSVHFLFGGQGKKPVICFHGYGETASSFEFLEKYAGQEFMFVAVELPFHGLTKWKGNRPFTIDDLKAITAEILQRLSSHEKLSLIGYSLGGRVALSLYQAIPEQVSKLILLAPDGLKINFWYWLSTQTWICNRFFRFTMRHPGWFFGFLKLLNKLRLVNASIFKFVNYYIGEEKVRQELYERWTCLRKLKPDIPVIKSLIKQNSPQVKLVYGKHDRIILPSTGKHFCKGIEGFCNLSIITSGHQVLHEKHIEEILPALQD